jgi:hypothetical protein
MLVGATIGFELARELSAPGPGPARMEPDPDPEGAA